MAGMGLRSTYWSKMSADIKEGPHHLKTDFSSVLSCRASGTSYLSNPQSFGLRLYPCHPDHLSPSGHSGHVQNGGLVLRLGRAGGGGVGSCAHGPLSPSPPGPQSPSALASQDPSSTRSASVRLATDMVEKLSELQQHEQLWELLTFRPQSVEPWEKLLARSSSELCGK